MSLSVAEQGEDQCYVGPMLFVFRCTS